MQKFQYYFVITFLLLASSLSFGQDRAKGYYKDIFFDGGIFLNSYPDLPAANYLNLSIEMFNSSKSEYLNALDTLIQTLLFSGSEIDENGILLYRWSTEIQNDLHKRRKSHPAWTLSRRKRP